MKEISCVCPHYGQTFANVHKRAIHWFRDHCRKSCSSLPPLKAEILTSSAKTDESPFEYIDRGDGTFLVGRKGSSVHLDHWHIAQDGTVFSVVENGVHLHRRTDMTKNIIELFPEIGFSKPWLG